MMGGMRPDRVFRVCVDELADMNDAQTGLVRPTEWTHHATTAPFQWRARAAWT
jgi:hypothetical protein